MTVKEWIDFLSKLDPDKNLVFIYDGSNKFDNFYANGEYTVSDYELMSPGLADYLNTYWSDLRQYPAYSDVPIYSPDDYCVMVG